MTEERGALIEAMARAIFAAQWEAGPLSEEGPPDFGRGGFKTEVVSWTAAAQAALTAITEAGYAIVPADAFHALDASHVALDDWLHTYASDQCRDEHVQTSRARIAEAGGTLAYIADLQQENRRVLKGMWDISAPIDTKEGE